MKHLIPVHLGSIDDFISATCIPQKIGPAFSSYLNSICFSLHVTSGSMWICSGSLNTVTLCRNVHKYRATTICFWVICSANRPNDAPLYWNCLNLLPLTLPEYCSTALSLTFLRHICPCHISSNSYYRSGRRDYTLFCSRPPPSKGVQSPIIKVWEHLHKRFH